MDFTPKLEQIRRNTSRINNLLRDARLVDQGAKLTWVTWRLC